MKNNLPIDLTNLKKCSVSGKDFLVKILKKDPSERLGHGGLKEVLDHPWFADDSGLSKEALE